MSGFRKRRRSVQNFASPMELETKNPHESAVKTHSIQLYLDSTMRNAGTTVADATFDIFQPITNLKEVKLESFLFVNGIGNVTLDDNVFEATVAGSVASDGTYTCTFEPGNWVCGSGTLVYTDVTATSGVNDIRHEIIRQWNDPVQGPGNVIESITLSPITSILTIQIRPRADVGGTITVTPNTTAAWVGFPVGDDYTFSTTVDWIASRIINLNTPQAIALASSTFGGSAVATSGPNMTARSGSYMNIIPLTSNFGDQQVWEPINPPTIRFDGENQMVNRVNIRVVMASTGGLVEGLEDTSWKLVLSLKQKVF